MTNLRDLKLQQVIPGNLTQDEKVRHLAQSVDTNMREVNDWADKLNYKLCLDDLPTAIINHMLYENHLTWNEGLLLAETHAQKVELLNAAIELHRTKGTPYAVERVLDVLGLKASIKEWFDYGGDPYHFKLKFDINWDFHIPILKMLIDEYKNERSWLENLTFAILDCPVNTIDHQLYLKKKLTPETSWFSGRYNLNIGSTIDGTWQINSAYLLNPSYLIEVDSINQVSYREKKKIEEVFNEHEENMALLINGDWSLDGAHTLDNPPRLIKLRPIQHEVSIFERKIYERVIDGTWYLDGSLPVGVPRLMNGTWDMDGEYLMDGDRTKDL